MASQPYVAQKPNQRQVQTAVLSLISGPMANAWLLVNPAIPSTITAFIQAVASIVYRFGTISAWQAAEAYEAKRREAGIPGAFTVRPADPANLAKVEAGVRWATQDLWKPEPDLPTIQSLVTGVVEKDILDAGRQTVLRAAQTDHKAVGWERDTDGHPCSFCAMLATRGPVYRSERSAEFQAHDHCKCWAEPVFGEYQMPHQVQEWKSLYQQSTRGAYGMKNMQKAFREAYDAAYPAATQ